MEMWMMVIMMKMIMIIKMAMMVSFMTMQVGGAGDGNVLLMLMIY